MSMTATELDLVEKLSKDVRLAAKTMTHQQARFFVDDYYKLQRHRMTASNQFRAARQSEEPDSISQWMFENFLTLEGEIQKVLHTYAKSQPLGQWALSVHGIGPVLAAGLLAHIDISKVNSAGGIWNFAGLAPGIKWDKGQKRPFNAKLKVLAWKIGLSFVMTSGGENAYYGRIYRERKQYEIARNESGALADQAEAKLREFKIGKETDAYKAYSQGKLPDAHIDMRARRYAVKMFLSHYFHVGYVLLHGEQPPKPFSIGILGHKDLILPPNMDVVGL